VNNFHFLWIGVRKDASSVRRDPFGLIIPVGIPLVLAILMNLVFGGSGKATPQGQLLIADRTRASPATCWPAYSAATRCRKWWWCGR
jgi:hypothetical protein